MLDANLFAENNSESKQRLCFHGAYIVGMAGKQYKINELNISYSVSDKCYKDIPSVKLFSLLLTTLYLYYLFFSTFIISFSCFPFYMLNSVLKYPSPGSSYLKYISSPCPITAISFPSTILIPFMIFIKTYNIGYLSNSHSGFFLDN